MIDPEKDLYIEVSVPRDRLEAEMKEVGGLLLTGLYHGKRRVRATQKRNRDFVIADSEKDLIKALGGNCIPDDMRKIDLREYGLSYESEIGPTRLEAAERDGITKIIRTDDWGDGARLPQPHENFPALEWSKRSSGKSVYLMFIFLPLFILNMAISNRLSQRGNGIALCIYMLSILVLGIILPDSKSWVKLIGLIYVTGSAMPFFAVSSGNQSRPYTERIRQVSTEDWSEEDELRPSQREATQPIVIPPQRPFLES